MSCSPTFLALPGVSTHTCIEFLIFDNPCVQNAALHFGKIDIHQVVERNDKTLGHKALDSVRGLKNTTVGGAARWEDKASIGYLGTAPDADGVIRSLDPTRPVFDKARTYFDAFITHNLTLGTKVRTRLQLNVRNAFEGGRLQTVGINPDGSPYNFRIVEPRQIIFSTTFDL